MVGESARERPHHAAPHAARVAERSAPPHTSADAVLHKFRTVRQEYASFKSQYGSVLEDRWNAIANEITFGKGDKFGKVDQMLDSLRHEMQRVRSGS